MSGVVTTDNAGGAVGVASSHHRRLRRAGGGVGLAAVGGFAGSTIRGSIGWSKVSSSANNDS
jgi:hypothetical protein